ncbi:MAG: enoyl-CoA hydratase/isomerase family protein [Ignavibacteriaceae bacterium]|nr:enoyl-CoA hydratase/isomerase family protein [Ignavibacteriaceae bacterium]
MDLSTLLFEQKKNYAIVTINRPDKLNALNNTVLTELKQVFSNLSVLDEIRCVIVTGAGAKSFVAGADIAEINKLDVPQAKVFAEFGQSVFSLIEEMNKPVIAAINGFALGGGAELAWSCHIRICSENALFGQPEVDLGLIPGYGGTQRLPRLISSSLAAQLLLTGEKIDAQKALALGLVNNVFKPEELLPKAEELADKISAKPALAVQNILKALSSTRQTGLNEGLAIEALLFSLTCGSDDFHEGTKAFLEKRKAAFKHK